MWYTKTFIPRNNKYSMSEVYPYPVPTKSATQAAGPFESKQDALNYLFETYGYGGDLMTDCGFCVEARAIYTVHND